jgi:NAD(P)H-nitrite reductase large subunit
MAERLPETRETLACRCEEITSEAIITAIVAGARSVDDVKRRTRAGMGACQGIYCMPAIAAMVAQVTGSAMDRVVPMTARPPVRTISLDALTALGAEQSEIERTEVRAEGD